MRPLVLEVKTSFKGACQTIAKKELSEGNFEGLADIMELPKSDSKKGKNEKCFAYFFVGGVNQESGPYCVISGRYRDRDDGEVAAIAIGLWDEERNCFSVLKKKKDGKSLPLPFRVKANKAHDIIKSIARAESLENVLELYEREAQKNL